MTRTCKFGCPVLLGEWDENARKYHEEATGELHTKERCEEAKANARRTQGENNHNHDNHGNELVESPKEMHQRIEGKTSEDLQAKGYVDHTLAGISQIITISGETTEEMDDLVNSWLKKEHGKIRFKGGQRINNNDGWHEITLYYEEIGK